MHWDMPVLLKSFNTETHEARIMGRDTDKRYITVGIPFKSDLLRLLQEDAQVIGTENLGQLLVLRAYDYYLLREKLRYNEPSIVARSSDIRSEISSIEENVNAAIDVWPDD